MTSRIDAVTQNRVGVRIVTSSSAQTDRMRYANARRSGALRKERMRRARLTTAVRTRSDPCAAYDALRSSGCAADAPLTHARKRRTQDRKRGAYVGYRARKVGHAGILGVGRAARPGRALMRPRRRTPGSVACGASSHDAMPSQARSGKPG